MSIDDTTQLIQLILNSVLMLLACAFVLGGLLLRRSVIENRLQITNVEYFQSLDRFDQSNRLLMLQKQIRYLQQRVKSANNGILVMYYAFILFVSSTFALAIRTVFSAEWLVTGSMALFVAGTAILLFSVAIVLVDLHQSDRPFWQEMRDILASDMPRKRRIFLIRSRRKVVVR
ncbi:MAG: DUF2721 domain-containing protein [Phormidium tanganyikae FI6-MK23]|jgi:hypothetical protein|nr:DUF2721 domain-containing protein [Phormidium tanganyikae FI6-MK23]